MKDNQYDTEHTIFSERLFLIIEQRRRRERHSHGLEGSKHDARIGVSYLIEQLLGVVLQFGSLESCLPFYSFQIWEIGSYTFSHGLKLKFVSIQD